PREGSRSSSGRLLTVKGPSRARTRPNVSGDPVDRVVELGRLCEDRPELRRSVENVAFGFAREEGDRQGLVAGAEVRGDLDAEAVAEIEVEQRTRERACVDGLRVRTRVVLDDVEADSANAPRDGHADHGGVIGHEHALRHRLEDTPNAFADCSRTVQA